MCQMKPNDRMSDVILKGKVVNFLNLANLGEV